jgi:hypothetical protein
MNANQMARQLLADAGSVGYPLGVGAALNVAPQFVSGFNPQQYYGQVGNALNVQPMMLPGTRVGSPAQMVPQAQWDASQKIVPYDNAAYNAGGLTYLGFGSTNVAAGATNVQIPINTQRPFTPQHLRMPSTNFGLLINGVLLEGTNLFANQDGVPVELFSEVSTAQQIPWPTLDTSTGIIFLVSNPTGAIIPFQGGFYGTQIRR